MTHMQVQPSCSVQYILINTVKTKPVQDYINIFSCTLGVFTVPTDGRYLLSVVIMAQKGGSVEAVLSVANRSIQKLHTAGVENKASTGCLCGGSASANLVLDLRQGQNVGVVKTSGTLAISASTEVLSTFSGVLLYPMPAKR